MHGKGVFTYNNGVFTYNNGDIYTGDWIENTPNGYGVKKYETAKQSGMIPAGSTYEGYWKDNKMHTEGSELGKLTWPSHDSDYPDKSTPCGLRSFEGQWENGNPKISREYDDFPANLENWGNYTWKKGEIVVLDQAQGLAYQIHQKGKKMQEKLGPALEFMDKERHEKTGVLISKYLDERPREFIQSLKKHGQQLLDNLSENEERKKEKIADLDRILVQLSTSNYVTNEETKRIIAICFYYALGELKSIEEGVEKVHFAGVEHERDFVSYYINTFIDDNASAYNGPNGMSCTQGIFERFFTVLESTLALAVAPGSEVFLGKDDVTIQERRAKYEKILDLWGRNKPKMADILAEFNKLLDENNPLHDSELKSKLINDTSEDKEIKIRIVIDFIKTKYTEAGQATTRAEGDFDEYLKNIFRKDRDSNRKSLFPSNDEAMFGGKRKTRRRRKKRTTRRRKGK